jgi:putative membrane protein
MFPWLPYVNEALIVSSAISMAIGVRQIRKQKVESHKRWMLLSSGLAALFFISYAAKTVFVGNTSFGGTDALRLPYQIFLQAHSILATVAGILGLLVIRFAFKKSFVSHSKVGRWTAPIWMVTAGSGLVVFLLLYVVFPPGPTVNVFQAWLGR